MQRTLTTSASAPPPSFFAHERAADSLSDLDIVRKIVEREGCLEALAQLLATHARAKQKESTISSMATLTAAPMVLQSLLDQLRSISVQITESISVWKQAHGSHSVFQWRSLNYQLKMVQDLDFLCLHQASIAHLTAFQGLRLERNPFLSPLHLDHAALRDLTPDAACRLTLFVGSVDMKRIFAATKALLEEEQAARESQQSTAPAPIAGSTAPVSTPTPQLSTLTTRLHWSHRPIKLALSPSPSLNSLTQPPLSNDPRDAMAYDVELAKELVFQHEHELGALREELAVAQKKLRDDQFTMPPDRKRQLQTKIASLSHDIQRRTGDLFHRRNELQRKEAVLRMDKRRTAQVASALHRQSKLSLASLPSPTTSTTLVPSPTTSPQDAEVLHFTALDSFKAALQADELRRQDLVEQFATYNKLRASMSVTKRRLQSMAAPGSLGSPTQRSSQPGSGGGGGGGGASSWTGSNPVASMSPEDVESFVNDLHIGDGYGSMLRAKGIDGVLLAQATKQDLEELGISIRLHRIKIVQAVAQAGSSLH